MLTMMLSRRRLLASLAAMGLVPFMRRNVAAEEARREIRYGWNQGVGGSKAGDIFVSPDGDDSASGAIDRPLRTIQRGVDLLGPRSGGRLVLRGGVYREQVKLSPLRNGSAESPYRIHRYGDERVTITAAEKLTGWMPCPLEERLGLGFSGSELYVTRLPARRILHKKVGALNLHEAGVARDIAVDRAIPTGTIGDQSTYHVGEFQLDEKNKILSITDSRLIGCSKLAMLKSSILLYHRPNMVSSVEVAAFDTESGKITLANHTYTMQPPQDGNRHMAYAIKGATWAITKGTWVAHETDPDEVSIYYWPENVSALEGDIEVSLRPLCIDFGAGVSHVELLGLEAVRASGEARHEGICIRSYTPLGSRPAVGLRLIDCRVGESPNLPSNGFGSIYLSNVDGVEIVGITIENVRCGIFVNKGWNIDMCFMHVSNASATPAIFYGLRDSVLSFSLFENSGSDAHSNKFNFYEGSDSVLVYGIRCRNVGGYATYQEASRIHFAFCDIPCDGRSSGRALVSQNRAPGSGQGGVDGSGDPEQGGTFYYWNNKFTPDGGHSEKPNALQLGPERSSQGHSFFNNIIHGGGLSYIYTKGSDPTRERRSHNLYTGLSYWQQAKYGWRLSLKERLMPLSAVSQARRGGMDVSSIINSEIAPRFPRFKYWHLDIECRVVDWANAPIGCQA